MPDAAKAELLRALGQLVRGLSTLFWALPLAWILYLVTAGTDWLETLGFLAFAPAAILSGALWHGLNRLRAFQKQERIWQRALNRAELFAVVNAGLTPFLFWWHRFPFIPLYAACVALLFLSSLFLIAQINAVLQRLSAMLPDETLRAETTLFTTFNIALLFLVLGGLAIFFTAPRIALVPEILARWIAAAGASGFRVALFLALLPLAMTMALLWKIKEVIFAAIIDNDDPPARRPPAP